MIQATVFIVTLGLMGVVLGAFVFVALNASQHGGDYAPIQKRAYSIRAAFFLVLVIAGIIIALMTTRDLPYAATRGQLADVDQHVEVIGYQWYWQLDTASAQAGDTVVFNVSAADVTHGLGIYDEQMRLLGQTQAMPGYSNALQMTFEKPGTYKLLCLEYCGFAHHAMIGEFQVSGQRKKI